MVGSWDLLVSIMEAARMPSRLKMLRLPTQHAGEWQLLNEASRRVCQNSLCCAGAHMVRWENSSISGIKFPHWPEDFAVSSAGARHPIYSLALWSLECQPLAETNDGQPLQLINYAKAINALSKQRLTFA